MKIQDIPRYCDQRGDAVPFRRHFSELTAGHEGRHVAKGKTTRPRGLWTRKVGPKLVVLAMVSLPSFEPVDDDPNAAIDWELFKIDPQ
jgi:hypothetical protein